MIELRNIYKSHGSPLSGLAHRKLLIPSRQIVGVLGENGSGKTTLLKTIMGLGELQEGQILFDGRPVVRQYERIAYITEEGSYFPRMPPLEYAAFLQQFYPSFSMKRYKPKFRKLVLAPTLDATTSHLL